MKYVMRLIVGFFCLIAGSAHATMITASSIGTYSNYGTSTIHTPNDYLVGSFIPPPIFEIRNYAVFDLSGLSSVSSATLRFNSGDEVFREDPVSIDFRSFNGAISDLTGGTASFTDLISGTLFGTISFSADFPDNTVVDLVLNAAAISAINSTSGLFAIAGSQSQATNTTGIAAGLNSSQVLLIVDVPEPTIFALMGLGLAGIGYQRRRIMIAA